MELISYLDTNVVVYLHSGNVRLLTPRAMEKIESNDVRISAMVLLELEMLYEKGKVGFSSAQILSDLSQQIGLSVCPLRFASIVNAATGIKWTRDPGDRLITANAIAANNSPLITSDGLIRENYANSIW